MSTAADEPDPTEETDWDRFMLNIEAIERATAPIVRPSSRPTDQVLPGSDDVGDLESRVATLSDAESDEEKVTALKDITRWLAQWKF